MNTAIISEQNFYASTWAKDFVKVFTNRTTAIRYSKFTPTINIVAPRFNIPLAGRPGPDQLISVVQKAVGFAGAGGILVFNVGHGVHDDKSGSADGWVDLAPGGGFRIGGLNTINTYVNVFYDYVIQRGGDIPSRSFYENDVRLGINSDKIQKWEKYKKLANIIKSANLRKVVFLTCNIGNAIDLVRKISIDFGTTCEAYKHKVQLSPQENNRVRIHLQTDPVGVRTNIPENEENLMVGLSESDVIRVKAAG